MKTSVDDTTPPDDFVGDLPSLLDDMARASALLASQTEVSDEVAHLLKHVAASVPLDDDDTELEGLDPSRVRALWAGLNACLVALLSKDKRQQRRDLRIAVERVRQALRDLLNDAPASEDRDLKEVARWLSKALNVSQPVLADLLSVPVRTLQRWLSPRQATTPTGDEASRLIGVARLTAHLRHMYTGPGVVRWLEEPHPDLKGARPIDLLADTKNLPDLVRLAAAARSQSAT